MSKEKICYDCIHCEVCEDIDDGIQMCYTGYKGCEHFKPKSRYIELPCAVGDTVYCINSIFVGKTSKRKKVVKPKVVDFVFTTPFLAESEGMILREKEFGKTIFLSKEEAEQALKGGAE